MLDRFLHDLIEKKFYIGGHQAEFLDCLLAVCATVFGVLLRFALNGTNGILLSDKRLSVYALIAVFVALAGGILVMRERSSIRRGLLCYTVLLFLPTMLLAGMTAGNTTVLAAKVTGKLSLACPNVFQLTGVDILVDGYAKAATAFTFALLCMVLFFCLQTSNRRGKDVTRAGKKEAGRMAHILKRILLVLLILTYFLPYMQYGNGLMIDILFVVLAFMEPKRIYRALIQTAVSFGAYTYGMTGVSEVPFYVFSFLELFLLVDLGMELVREALHEERQKDSGDGQRSRRAVNLVFLLVMTVLACLIRFPFRNIPSMDYLTCLKPWVEEFQAAGSFRAIAGDFYNYTPTYMYILYFISLLGCEPLLPIKLVSCLFDLLLALLCYRIIKKLTGSISRAALAYGIILCLPTVAVNSGMWGQCDVIYVTCIIASLYLLYENRPHASMLLYGLAFAIKLQALFVFPVYVLLWVHKKYKIGQFLYLPFVYILTCIPAALAGKSIKELLLVYVNQGNTEPWMLSWNWPNIYLLFGPTNFYETYKTAGILGTLAVIMLVLYETAKKWRTIDNRMILQSMLVFALLVPFTLPYMHERYGYLADILMVLYAIVCPGKLYLAVLQILLSFTAYLGYLHGSSAVPQVWYCFGMIFLIVDVMREVFANGKCRQTGGI